MYHNGDQNAKSGTALAGTLLSVIFIIDADSFRLVDGLLSSFLAPLRNTGEKGTESQRNIEWLSDLRKMEDDRLRFANLAKKSPSREGLRNCTKD